MSCWPWKGRCFGSFTTGKVPQLQDISNYAVWSVESGVEGTPALSPCKKLDKVTYSKFILIFLVLFYHFHLITRVLCCWSWSFCSFAWDNMFTQDSSTCSFSNHILSWCVTVLCAFQSAKSGLASMSLIAFAAVSWVLWMLCMRA